MVSDYFVIGIDERKKKYGNDEERVAAEIQRRINEYTNFLLKFLSTYGGEHRQYYRSESKGVKNTWAGDTWVCAAHTNDRNLEDYSLYDRVAFNRKVFDEAINAWNQKYRIKIDEQDWRYALYNIMKTEYNQTSVSYADMSAKCILMISAELPPCCYLGDDQMEDR